MKRVKEIGIGAYQNLTGYIKEYCVMKNQNPFNTKNKYFKRTLVFGLIINSEIRYNSSIDV